MKSLGKSAIPRQMLSELEKVGEDIRHARIRRKFTMEELSKRAGISRATLDKVEKGSPNVSIGIYARVLFILGITGTVCQLADLSNDPISRDLEISKLPLRVKKS
ncbi:MAG: helix-turn-helix transcriptional regulator [Mariprofundaceae bacterium]|nr:helix-turn-helix transcriptional regulator [Mariprofundaceae bacterium]